MRKAFKYRLYPTRKQTGTLATHLEECRMLYNHFVVDRIQAYKDRGESLSLYDQQARLSFLKLDRPTLSQVHSQVLQNVAVRVDLAFQAFFRRVKVGGVPGFPRFRGLGRYDSLTYPQAHGFEIKEGALRLGKIGRIRIKAHRPLEGTSKTCTVRRSATGKWYASIVCEVEPQPLPKSDEAVGIDVGLEKFATLSNGDQIAPPRFFRQEEQVLAKAQRKLSKQKKGTSARAKARKVVARVHERIRFRRHDFAHQLARCLVNHYGLIAVEDLIINGMVRNHCLSKSIHDAAWSQFRQCLSYKAEEAGRTLVAVNPAYTSQDCSQCGHRHRKALSERVHVCPCCGVVLDRDENAARNILRLGLQSQVDEPPRSPSLEAWE
ncbi:MAG: IS200/IS605 family element transposase accessory protein TnpB [Gemmatimonadetes bacterium]|nr:IS200/IS605 family element transposase accessory protein TnpB [Gemmatimonadota bacterium]MYK40924.1 IS200/IS605 family element transposase accessory protein TnpB [Gemmatimonadota bacterium]